ncbi:hypothetical protein D3C72_1416600 [compost metagenome]
MHVIGAHGGQHGGRVRHFGSFWHIGRDAAAALHRRTQLLHLLRAEQALGHGRQLALFLAHVSLVGGNVGGHAIGGQLLARAGRDGVQFRAQGQPGLVHALVVGQDFRYQGRQQGGIVARGSRLQHRH